MRSRLLPLPALAGCFIAFTLIGTIQALYGPLLPRYQDTFSLSTSAVGMLLTAHFIGGLIGVLGTHRARAHYSDRTLLIASMWLMGIGIAAVGFAPSWPMVLTCAFAAGLGFGGIDFGLNQYFADLYAGPRAAAMLNLLNGCFGVGSIAAPLLVATTNNSLSTSFFLCAGLTVLAALLSITLPKADPGPRAAATTQTTPTTIATTTQSTPTTTRTPLTRIGTGVLAVLIAFFIIYIFHVGIETGVGGWEQTYLEVRGMNPVAAHTWVALYWGGMTASRFAIIPLALRFSERAIVLTCLVAMTAALAIAALGIVPHWAYLAVGVFIGPIFPTCIPWLNRLVPQVGGATAYVVAISMIGGVGFPPLLGAAMAAWGSAALPITLTAMSVICLGAYFVITSVSGARKALA